MQLPNQHLPITSTSRFHSIPSSRNLPAPGFPSISTRSPQAGSTLPVDHGPFREHGTRTVGTVPTDVASRDPTKDPSKFLAHFSSKVVPPNHCPRHAACPENDPIRRLGSAVAHN
uniref:Uncharacterized protein n=1 Tax=Pseudo-nitzschia australis TaxID=44445 RepID=A0A7S4ARB7_9STRA